MSVIACYSNRVHRAIMVFNECSKDCLRCRFGSTVHRRPTTGRDDPVRIGRSYGLTIFSGYFDLSRDHTWNDRSKWLDSLCKSVNSQRRELRDLFSGCVFCTGTSASGRNQRLIPSLSWREIAITLTIPSKTPNRCDLSGASTISTELF